MAKPVVIGITGGIGSGKSAALEAFRRRGAATFSADEAVHALYRSDEVRELVRTRWGAAVVGPDSQVDRDAVATIVFADPAELAWLEGELHPRVAQQWSRFLAHAAEDHDLIVAEVPLLFEAGVDERYDATLLITAPLEERLRRVGERAKGHRNAAGRAARQLSEEEKQRLADYTYVNDGSLEDLQRFVDELIARLGVGGDSRADS